MDYVFFNLDTFEVDPENNNANVLQEIYFRFHACQSCLESMKDYLTNELRSEYAKHS